MTLVAAAAALHLVLGCSSAPQPSLAVREVTPAFLDTLSAFDPAIAADPHGRLALTYVTRADSGRKDVWLAVSSDSGASFATPVRVNERAGSVVSFAEGRPLPVFGPSGSMVVVWMERRENAAAGVDLVTRGSGDGGATLGPLAWINDDRTAKRGTFHGFPTMTYRADGSLFAAWLDERRLPDSDEEPSWSSLYSAVSVDGGQTWSPNRAVRDTVCPCCRPSAVAGENGAVAIAFRAANRDERDPALAVSHDGGESFALDTLMSADHWSLKVCPDVGPALLWNRSDGGAYAWLTEAGDPGVYLVPWRAETGAGGVKRKLDDVVRATHPRLAEFGDASLVAVEARSAADTTRTVLAVRVLEPSGALAPWTFLGGDVRAGWIAGAGGPAVFACWTENEPDRSRLRVVRLARR
jgi:hypothetical protein